MENVNTEIENVEIENVEKQELATKEMLKILKDPNIRQVIGNKEIMEEIIKKAGNIAKLDSCDNQILKATKTLILNAKRRYELENPKTELKGRQNYINSTTNGKIINVIQKLLEIIKIDKEFVYYFEKMLTTLFSKNEVESTIKKWSEVEAENEKLRQEIQGLKTNMKSLEALVREKDSQLQKHKTEVSLHKIEISTESSKTDSIANKDSAKENKVESNVAENKDSKPLNLIPKPNAETNSIVSKVSTATINAIDNPVNNLNLKEQNNL